MFLVFSTARYSHSVATEGKGTGRVTVLPVRVRSVRYLRYGRHTQSRRQQTFRKSSSLTTRRPFQTNRCAALPIACAPLPSHTLSLTSHALCCCRRNRHPQKNASRKPMMLHLHHHLDLQLTTSEWQPSHEQTEVRRSCAATSTRSRSTASTSRTEST